MDVLFRYDMEMKKFHTSKCDQVGICRIMEGLLGSTNTKIIVTGKYNLIDVVIIQRLDKT